VTALELRHAAIGYSERAVRAAVDAGLAECPVAEAAGDRGFAELVTFWLVDPQSWEWFTPPLPEATVAAIHRWLLAVAH
jgi:hypothetical protein